MKLWYLILFSTTSFAQSYDFDKIKLLSVYDGDTIKVEIKEVHPFLGKKLPIRISGIDTAEIRTKKKCEKAEGLKAKEFVKARLDKATNIDLKNCVRGKYFRAVCDVYYDGKNIAEDLIEHRFAYPYFGETKTKVNWCRFRNGASVKPVVVEDISKVKSGQ